MRVSQGIFGVIGLAWVVLCSACLPAQEVVVLPPAPEPGVAQVSYEVATRGPLHEAFAKPFSSDPMPGVTIDVAPPAPVEELPPDIAPAGDNVVWVPGYWGWEPDAETFIWISGIWRNAPPGQQWVPGYWTEVDGQHQWVSGFWTSEDTQAIVYLPFPPEGLDDGPDSAPPAGDYFWVPGTWLWVGNEYQWQPGYWSQAFEEWVWNPAEYVWTPYGCIYTAGYWDYRPTDRGIVFAPVYIRPALARTQVIRYTPNVIVQVPQTLVHWFVSPRYHHYYFGNYYGGNYAQVNLMPWHAYHGQRGYYDPLLNYYRWYYARQNVDFIDRLSRWHRFYVSYEDRRPPVTFGQQRAAFGRLQGDATVGSFRLAQSLEDVIADREAERRFRRIERERRQELAQAADTLRQVQRLRHQVERMATQRPGERGFADRGSVRRLELPDQVRRGLRVNRDWDEQRADIVDRRRPDGRDGDRPRGPDFARDRDQDRGRFEGTRRPGDRDQERVRAARPVTPDDDGIRDDDGARRGRGLLDQQRPAPPDDRVRGRGEREAAAEPQRPPIAPRQNQIQRPERGPGRGQPGSAQADRPFDPRRAGPQARGGDEARQRGGVPQRGQARGFDGRSLPVPEQARQGRSDQVDRDEPGAQRGRPPFSARRSGPAEAERDDRARGASRGRGPLDQQPPEVDRRGGERSAPGRGPAAQTGPRPRTERGPAAGRGPAAERADRDDRRGPPQRGERGRQGREEDDDRENREPEAEEPGEGSDE